MRHQFNIFLTGIILLLGTATPLWGQVFISTLGDPNDNYQNDRFIEIYNSGACAVDLSVYSIKIYSNVSSSNIASNSDIITLSGILNLGTAYTIGLPTSTYFHDRSGVIDAGTYSQWNGQERDGASLYLNNTLIDSVVAVPGSTASFFANGYLERNPSICNPNPVFDGSEWTYYTADSISHSSPGTHTVNCTTSTATLAIPQDSICFSADSLVLWPFVSDSSGFFSGPGVQNDSVFYPYIAGNGSIEIQYSITLPTCTITLLDTLEVFGVSALITPLAQDTVCQSSGPISLSGTPAGGTFYFDGTALPGNSLDLSSVSSTDLYNIVYEVTDNGCSDSDTVPLYVLSDNPYSTSSIPSQIGIYEPPITFSNLGTYVLSGTGTSDSVFFPHSAGIGTHTLTLTDSTGCSSPISISIDVVDYISINNLIAPSSTSICPGDTATLVASNSGLNGTQSYSDSILPFFYRPISGGTSITFSDEDHHSGLIALPFNFCFYGQTFDQLVVSSNGYITFDSSKAGTNSPWTANPIPTDSLPNLSIFGPWSDYNTNFGNISYKIEGSAPFRKFILEYNDVVIWASSSYITTQIHLYESTNFIETHILEREFYANRELIHGLKKDSLDYHIISGRNYQVTSIFNESRRFYPDGAGDIVWFDDTGNLIASGDTLRVSPTDSTSYTALAGCALNDTVGLSSQVFVYVNPFLSNSLLQSTDTLCPNDPVFNLSQYTSNPLPSFTIDGNPGSLFDPSAFALGSTIEVILLADGTTCMINDTMYIYIDAQTQPQIDQNDTTLCTNSGPFNLSGNLAGGTFSGISVNGSIFNPASASFNPPQTVQILYGDLNSQNCVIFDTLLITVVNPPQVSLSSINDSICSDEPVFTPTFTPSSGGIITLDGNTVSSINPSTLNPGIHIVTYTYTDPTGCSGTASDTFTLFNANPVSISLSKDTLCADYTPFTFTANLAGGEWIVNGSPIVGDQIIPNNYLGPNQVIYNYGIGTPCPSSDTATLFVLAMPNVGITNVPDSICFNANAIPISATPAGGTYFGTGLTTGLFDPVSAGIGTHTIGYTFVNADGCTDTATHDIVVYQDTGLSFDIQPDTLCISSGNVSLSATPTGGFFIGPGVMGTSFDLLAAGIGTHVLKYVLPGGLCIDTLYDTLVVEEPLDPGQSAIIFRCVGNISMVNLFSNLLGSPDAGGTWTDPNGNSVPNGIVSGTTALDGIYTYTVSNSCGTFTSQVTLNINPEPIVNGAGPVIISPGQSPVLPTNYIQGNNLQYNWSPGLSLIDSTVNNPTTVPLFSNTTFVFTVEDSITGCQDTGFVDVLVTALPLSINPTADQSIICAGNATTMNANAAGGSTLYQYNWSPGNIFSDSTIANPTITITNSAWVYLTVFDGSDTITDSVFIQVESPVAVNLPPIGSICTNGGQQSINNGASPSGGIFSGPGIVNGFIGIFDPLASGPGAHNIVYTYTSTTGCTYSDTQQVVVHVPSTLTIGTAPFFCTTSAPDTLSFVFPLGGTYSGNGVTNNVFDPASVGIGVFPLTYTFVDSNGCQISASVAVTVGNAPNVTLGSLGPICENQSPFPLNNGSPSGGTYSGPGIVNDSLFPNLLTPGVYSITYDFTNGQGCSGQAVSTFTIEALPSVQFTSPGTICLNAGPTPITGGSPAGGIYSGNGIIGGQFLPNNAGLGTHQIIYTYSNAAGCTTSDTSTITVISPTAVSFLSIPQYCVSDGIDTLNFAQPYGGTYSGPQVTNGTFNPATAGAGNHQITYTYVDSNGCSSVASANVVVHALPGVYMNSITPLCYDASPLPLTQGTPFGGSYSGPGVFNDTLFPNVSGPGTHPITYIYTNSNGCTDSTTINVTVLGPPNLNYPSLDTVCLNNGNFPITTASPSGGSYSGPGVTNGIFNPIAAGLGTHSIQYIYTNNNGCSDTITSDITVTNPPPVIWSNFDSLFCITEPAFSLNGLAQPGGGTYSGNGVTGNVFNPALAGPGTHNISYTYLDANGCTATGVRGITVVALPSVSIASQPDVCFNEAAFQLSGGLPFGGTYFGPGITNGVFDPSVAGTGNITIGYTFTNSVGCRDTAYQNLFVDSIPTLTQIPYSDYCVDANPVQLTGANPGGGTYFGNHVFAGHFYPGNAGTGLHTVYYRYTNGAGCSDTLAFDITVNPLPNVQMSILDTVCSNDSAFALTQGTPAGGTYSGPGVVNNIFYPNVAGHGNHVISYTYVDTNGCSSIDKEPIHVVLSPPIPIITENGNYLVCNWGFYQYQWYLDGVPIQGANAISHLAVQPGYYQVQITNDFGCSSISGVYFLDIVSAEEHFLDQTILFPNPSTGNFTVSFGQTIEMGKLSIYDITGRIIMTENLINLDEIKVDLNDLASGIYTLEIIAENRYFYEQLVLEK